MPASGPLHHPWVQPEPLLSREELVGMLFNIADMSENVERIRDLLEGELGGEQGLEEDTP